jgi:uncharacterized membrane protein
MANDPKYEELLGQIAKLAERVHKLEQLISSRSVEAVAPPPTPPLVFRDGPTDASSSPHPPAGHHKKEDLESQIGGHWLNRVGIVTVLIGVSYFLKYAFDNEWVGPAGRIVIGLVGGLGIVFWSERVRRDGYFFFSNSVKAIGIGVLYLSLWAASQVYHLIPNTLAFAAMTSVTAATIGLALWQDAEVIAAFAAVGAFVTPVALSTGENNAVGLFTYITILDAGALVLWWSRSWVRVLVGSYAGTLILYWVWHSRFYTPAQLPIALTSVSVAFIAFGLTPFLDRRGRESRDSNTVLLIALVNAGAYFFEVWEVLDHASATRESAGAAVLLGVLYLVAAELLQDRAPATTAQLHAAVGSAFLVLAVPIGLDAQWITLGWLFEAAALIEVSRRTRNKTLNLISSVALALGICRILFLDRYGPHAILFNERMLTSLIAVAVLVFVARSLAVAKNGDSEKQLVPLLIIAINAIALVALNREITDAFEGIVRDFAYSALWMAYGAGLMFVGFWKSSRFLRWQALILIFVTVFKVFLFDTASLNRGYRIMSFIALGLVLLVTSFLYQRKWLKTN